VTAGEFAFLAIGLLLGVGVGAGIVEVLRSRPPAPRQIRVTISPDSVPTRAPTLAADPFEPGQAGPAPYGPGDRRLADRPSADASPSGTPVHGTLAKAGRDLVPITIDSGDADARTHALPVPDITGPRPGAAVPATALVAAAVAPSIGPLATAAETDPGSVDATPNGSPSTADGPPFAAAAGAAMAVRDGTDVPDAGGPGPSPTGPCAELVTVAQDRCAVAERARESSAAAQDALREAQRSYDDHQARADEAEAIADPRQVRVAKEAAQTAFRRARDAGRTREDVERAASTWLDEINRINRAARDATNRATKERAAARALVVVIERLSLEADAARIGAESAAEACLRARDAVADCQEAEARGRREAEQREVERRSASGPYPEEAPELDLQPSEGRPRILRMLQGDGDALVAAASELGGDDVEARRHWQLQLTQLCDAIVAQAIDSSAIDLPDDQPFFEPFTRAQRRDIISALASLGYRYDGLGGFDDGRIPSQRDLSLAVGYAGLDPMRVRRWPAETEMPELLGGATVAADEYLAGAAGGLTLGELVDLLGRRADGLTDLWNDWGRVRAHLLVVDGSR
jgi:hypothetical protein